MNDKMIPFQFEGADVRVHVDDQNEPWWVLADLCKVLGINNPADVLKRLESIEYDGIDFIDPIGRHQNMTVVNESGLYRTIFRSNKAEAKRFQTWVFTEVLPQIRKTGKYEPTSPAISLPTFHNPSTQIAIETLIRIDAMEQRQLEQEAQQREHDRQIAQLQAAQQYLSIREFVAFHQLTHQIPPGTAQQAFGKFLVGHCKEQGWPLRKVQTEGYSEWQYPAHVIQQTLQPWLARRNGQLPMDIRIEKDGIYYEDGGSQ